MLKGALMSNSERQSVAIIGAGVTGLAAAFDLARAGFGVTIFEAGDRVGGLAAGFKDETWDWPLEKFYHHWFESDREIIRLIDDIGQRDRLIWPRPKTSFWIDGKIYRSEISPSVLRLPLSPVSMLRFVLTGAYIKFTPFWKPLERVTADAWMRRYMGDEAYNKFFRPLLIGKFGDLYTEINMAWLWARVVSRSLKLGAFEGGFQGFLDLLADEVQGDGAEIRLQTPVTHVERVDDGLAVTAGDDTRVFDHVISATSPAVMLKLCPALADTDYGEQMRQLKSIGGLCVVLALKRQLLTDGTYWLNLPAESADSAQNKFPFLALVEHTNYMDRAHYGGDHIVYCGDYVHPDHEYFSMTEEELVERFLPALATVNPDFDPEWVRKSWVWRAPYAQPAPGINHSAKIPPLETPITGLTWASMSQVYPWDRGTNYAVEMGRRVARGIIDKAR